MEKAQVLEYIWIDHDGKTRSKTMVLQNNGSKLSQCPEWNFDGSSTNQATGNDSEVIIKPVKIVINPFQEYTNDSYLVLCDTWLSDGSPHPDNTRVKALSIFNKYLSESPRYGLEQEFFLTNVVDTPIAWLNGEPKVQGDYYCGSNLGRECVIKAFNRCLKAGLHITGMNSEVAPSQWELQISDYGINAADELYLMRYILSRTAVEFGGNVTFEPKPIPGDWNGSGCHINFSTLKMRTKGGYNHIIHAVDKLSMKHDLHMKHYGKNNEKRMTGLHETASYDKFTYGVADRGASIRIPTAAEKNQCGYLEDRRPAANIDPYVCTSLLLETVCEK